MFLIALLILGYGPLDWTFPWWVWFLALTFSGTEKAISTYLTGTVKLMGKNLEELEKEIKRLQRIVGDTWGK